MEKSPCTTCPKEEKYEACHDSCFKFLDWKRKKDAIREKIFAKEKTYAIFNQKTKNRIEGIHKSSGRKKR